MIGEGWEAVFFEALIKKDGLWFVTTAVSTLTIGGEVKKSVGPGQFQMPRECSAQLFCWCVCVSGGCRWISGLFHPL